MILIRRIIFKIKLFLILSTIFMVIFFTVFFIQFEKHFIPTAILFSEKYATNVISNTINESVRETIKNYDVYNLNFLQNYSNESGTNYLNINNVLINEICTEVSSNLSNKLSNILDNKISLPIGTLTGISFLSNFGPNLNLTVNSMGNATVDYETKFVSVGINQINLQVWLEINTQMALVNSIYSKEVNVKRNLMLINIVFNGQVPSSYFNVGKQINPDL